MNTNVRFVFLNVLLYFLSHERIDEGEDHRNKISQTTFSKKIRVITLFQLVTTIEANRHLSHNDIKFHGRRCS